MLPKIESTNEVPSPKPRSGEPVQTKNPPSDATNIDIKSDHAMTGQDIHRGPGEDPDNSSKGDTTLLSGGLANSSSQAFVTNQKADTKNTILIPTPVQGPQAHARSFQNSSERAPRSTSELMGEPLLIATMAMKDINQVLQKYTKLGRDLQSHDSQSVAAARSELIHIYREDFPELVTVVSGESDFLPYVGHNSKNKFELEAFEVYRAACETNREYFKDLNRHAFLALFDSSMIDSTGTSPTPPAVDREDHKKVWERA